MDFGQKKKKQTQHFSFSKSNTDKLLNILIDNHNALMGSDPDCPNLNYYLDTFSNAIDKTCKLSIPKSTIRNAINNPWITDSVINSIEIKQSLYNQWKKSCTVQFSNGDDKLYKVYSVYRYQLKHVIKYIKRNFYSKKISEVSGDPKKTWQIINQIRRKLKKVIEPQFLKKSYTKVKEE